MTSRRPYLCTKQWIGGHVCVQKNPVGIELFSHVKTFFYSKQCAKLQTTWLKTMYRFHVAVRLFINRSQMTSKCGRHKEVAHEPQAFWRLLWPITELIHGNMESICFIAELHANVAPYLRKCGNPPIRKILVITCPYAHPPAVRLHHRHTNVK